MKTDLNTIQKQITQLSKRLQLAFNRDDLNAEEYLMIANALAKVATEATLVEMKRNS